MTNHHGDFIWYELMTTDADAVTAFYRPLIDWRFGRSAEYREITVEGGDFIGGMLPLTDDVTAGGARPAWLGYCRSTMSIKWPSRSARAAAGSSYRRVTCPRPVASRW
jgi:predicted enzyme related to lactoylglutathione lyase